jgi:hypothetical protein
MFETLLDGVKHSFQTSKQNTTTCCAENTVIHSSSQKPKSINWGKFQTFSSLKESKDSFKYSHNAKTSSSSQIVCDYTVVKLCFVVLERLNDLKKPFCVHFC